MYIYLYIIRVDNWKYLTIIRLVCVKKHKKTLYCLRKKLIVMLRYLIVVDVEKIFLILSIK